MKYVNPTDVLVRFVRYLEDYSGEMISKNVAIDELRDALDDAEYQEVDE